MYSAFRDSGPGSWFRFQLCANSLASSSVLMFFLIVVFRDVGSGSNPFGYEGFRFHQLQINTLYIISLLLCLLVSFPTKLFFKDRYLVSTFWSNTFILS